MQTISNFKTTTYLADDVYKEDSLLLAITDRGAAFASKVIETFHKRVRNELGAENLRQEIRTRKKT